MRPSLRNLVQQPFVSIEAYDAAATQPIIVDDLDAVEVPEEDVDQLIDEGAEPFMAISEDIDESLDAKEELGEVTESLEAYAVSLEALIKDNACTKHTAELIERGVQKELSRLGLSLKRPSMESYGDDVVTYHQVTLEAVRDVLHRITQTIIMTVHHHIDFAVELFRSTRGSLRAAKSRLDDAKERIEKKEREGLNDKTVTGSLAELWYHFRTDKGQATDIIPAVKRDVELSRYVLVDNPKEILTLTRQLIGVLKGANVGSDAGVKALAAKVSAMKHPADVFRKDYIGGRPFLSVTGFQIKQSKAPTATALGGEKLAQLAQSRTVVEDWDLSHEAMKVGAYAASRVANSVASGGAAGGVALAYGVQATHAFGPGEVKLTIDQLKQVVSFGNQYIENVNHFLSIGEQLVAASKELTAAFAGLAGANAITAEGKLVVKQVQAYADNIATAMWKPSSSEVKRSFKGAKYCSYLAVRMSKYAK